MCNQWLQYATSALPLQRTIGQQRDGYYGHYRKHSVTNGYRIRTPQWLSNTRSVISVMDTMGGNEGLSGMVTCGERETRQRWDNTGNLWAGIRIQWHGFCLQTPHSPAFRLRPSGSIEAVPLSLGKFFLKFF